MAADPRPGHWRAFVRLNNCAQCHGSDARGSKGFPNLTTTGCTAARRKPSASTLEKGRISRCPMAAPWVPGRRRRNLSHYVLSLSGSPTRCAHRWSKAKFHGLRSLHGMDGKGNQARRAQPDR